MDVKSYNLTSPNILDIINTFWNFHSALCRYVQPQALDDWTFFFFFFFFFFCIFTRLETLTICSCNYFTFKTFSINPQSTLVYGLLYRQGRKRGVLVLVGSWDSPHLKLILHPLPLFQCWLSTHECLCKRSRPLPSFKISTTARKNLQLQHSTELEDIPNEISNLAVTLL